MLSTKFTCDCCQGSIGDDKYIYCQSCIDFLRDEIELQVRKVRDLEDEIERLKDELTIKDEEMER
jgi:hypothetical protein